MATYSNTAREVEMPNGDVVVIHNAPTGGENTTSNIKKFKYDDNGHVTESTAADAEDLNLSGYSTPTTGTTAIGTSDDIQTAIGKLDHQSHIDQSNILYALETGANNLCPESYLSIIGNSRTKSLAVNLPAGKYYISCTGTLASGVYADGVFKDSAGNNVGQASGIGNGANAKAVTLSSKAVEFYFWTTDANATFDQIMIVPETVWNTLDHSFRVAALPNYDLTRLEAEDRASLAEVVDSGAKNLINLDSCTIAATDNRITFTRNGNVITASCTGISDVQEISITNLSLPTNTALIISGCPSGGGDNTYMIDYFNGGGYVQGQTPDTGSGSGIVTFTTMTNSRIRIRIAPNTVFTNKEFKIMVCTKAAFCISPKFVPYRSAPELCAPALSSTAMRSGSLDDISTTSYVRCDDTVANKPMSGVWGFVRTDFVEDGRTAVQQFTSFSTTEASSGQVYVRVMVGGTWQSWKALTNT